MEVILGFESYVSKLELEKAQLNLIMVVIDHHNHKNIRSWAMSNNHTILGQMVQMFSRFEFQKAVNETKTEYHARGFRSWNHFTSMLFGQLSGQDSQRGIEAGLTSHANTLMPMNFAPMSFLKNSLNGCCPNVNPWLSNISSDLRTPCTASIQQ